MPALTHHNEIDEILSEYIKINRQDVALLMLEGFIERTPNNFHAIQAYVDLATSTIEACDYFEQQDRFVALGNFVKSRIPYAEPSTVRRLVDLAEDLERRSEEQTQADAEDPQVSESAVALLQRAQRAPISLTSSEKADTQSLIEIIGALEEALSYADASVADENIINRLHEALANATELRRFDEAMASFNELLKSCTKLENPRRGYVLQQADRILQEFSASTALSEFRCAKVYSEASHELTRTAEKAALDARQSAASIIYAAFERSFKSDLSKISGRKNPGQALEANEFRQKQIRDFQLLLERAIDFLPRVKETQEEGSLKELVRSAQLEIEKAALDQQLRYDRWSLSKIQGGYRECMRHAGFIDHEEEIAKAMIKHFGQIDSRNLGPELQRMYNEVFEHIFRKLNEPSNDAKKSIENKGGKLFVLEKMMSEEKLAPRDF